MRAEMPRVSTKLVARIKANCFTKSILITAFTAKARIFCNKIFTRKMQLKLSSWFHKPFILSNLTQYVSVKNCVSEFPENQISVFKTGLLFSSILKKVTTPIFLARLEFQLKKSRFCKWDFKASDECKGLLMLISFQAFFEVKRNIRSTDFSKETYSVYPETHQTVQSCLWCVSFPYL